ncbi:Phosphatidylinositide phosphatase SAC1, partial [Nowakowskiella sp. JEL0407]
MLSGSLSLHSSASHVAICASATSPALVVDKASGLLSLSTNVALSQTPLTCYGIVGTLSLNEGDLLIVVTAREEIGAWRDSVVYKLTDYTLINASLPTPNLSAKQVSFPFIFNANFNCRRCFKVEDDAVFKMLLADIFTSKFFYFSYTFDLTQSLQRRNGLNFADPLWKRADDRFFWNKNLNINLIERAREDPRFSDFILPITVGCTINGKTFDYGLLSRRSRHRAGTRYNSRGVNDEGHVSNFVETEQLIFDHSSGQESSYVQTRGSIPLYWRQLINAKYTPALNIDHNPKTAESFKLHFTTQLDVYGDQIAVNLINKKGYELRLGKEFEKQIGNLNDPRVKYIHFDFHHECKNMRWDRISVLVDKIEKDLQQQG